MAIRDERWRLVVVYASGRREGEEAASHPLIGLDERTVCRIFGFKGSHVPSFPVEVHTEHLSELQPYAAKPVRLPAGTYAELVLDRDATTARDLIPLLAITVLVFSMLRLIPGDPAAIVQRAIRYWGSPTITATTIRTT